MKKSARIKRLITLAPSENEKVRELSFKLKKPVSYILSDLIRGF
jgi:hypothetical protein